MLAGNGLGFHPVVRHGIALSHDGGESSVGPRARLRDASRRQSLYPLGSIAP